MIAHLSRTHWGSRAGHFMNILSVAPEGLDAIDPVTGLRTPHWSWQSFSRAWSGVCLVLERRSYLRDPLFFMSVLNLTLWGMVFWSTLKAVCAVPLAWLKQVALVAICILSLPEVALAETAMHANEVLRSHARDGINAAALMLSCVSGKPTTRLDCIDRKTDMPASLEDIRSLLYRHGCPTALRSLNFSELSHSVPSIAMLRYGAARTGSCCLIVDANENNVTVLRAGSVVVHVMPTDEFRRRWTGHALIVIEPYRTRRLAVMAFFPMFGLGLVLGLTMGRTRYLWNDKPHSNG
jgi:hypothetical protein